MQFLLYGGDKIVHGRLMEYNRQADEGLYEVEAVRSAVLKLQQLVALLAVHNHTGLLYKVEDCMGTLSRYANQAEAEIKERVKR